MLTLRLDAGGFFLSSLKMRMESFTKERVKMDWGSLLNLLLRFTLNSLSSNASRSSSFYPIEFLRLAIYYAVLFAKKLAFRPPF